MKTVEPIVFVVAAAAVNGEREIGHNATGFEITNFWVAAGTAYKGDGVDAHGEGFCG